ncbi:MAG: hypothetical protein ACK4H7_01690 [Acidilobaceae archaeon]
MTVSLEGVVAGVVTVVAGVVVGVVVVSVVSPAGGGSLLRDTIIQY